MNKPFKNVLIIDDHGITRIGIKVLLNELFKDLTIHEAKDGTEAEVLIAKYHYDLITLDLNLPDTDSMVLLKRIIKTQPKTKVLVISMNNEDVYALHVIRSGAMGYVSKENGFESIKDAALKLSKNKKYVSENVITFLLEEDKGSDSNNPFKRLSDRELEIAKLLLDGVSTKNIALKINLQVTTVSTHKNRIFEKLQVSNSIELYELCKLYHIS